MIEIYLKKVIAILFPMKNKRNGIHILQYSNHQPIKSLLNQVKELAGWDQYTLWRLKDKYKSYKLAIGIFLLNLLKKYTNMVDYIFYSNNEQPKFWSCIEINILQLK